MHRMSRAVTLTAGPCALQHDFRSCLGAATGAVRVSLGRGSTFADLCRLLDFLRRFTA